MGRGNAFQADSIIAVLRTELRERPVRLVLILLLFLAVAAFIPFAEVHGVEQTVFPVAKGTGQKAVAPIPSAEQVGYCVAGEAESGPANALLLISLILNQTEAHR